MKICIAAENGAVCPHFGHCTEFAIFEVEGDEIKDSQTIANPGHAPGTLPPILQEWGVNTVISGGMGTRAVSMFQSMGIDVVTGAQGRLEEIAKSYATGELSTQENVCDHSGDHGGHGHDGCH